MPFEVPILKKGKGPLDEKRPPAISVSVREALPQLPSPRSPRSPRLLPSPRSPRLLPSPRLVGSEEATPRLLGALPSLHPAEQHRQQQASHHQHPAHHRPDHEDGSPPPMRGGKPLPWVDASGALHLPKSYRNAVKLSPNMLGAMTAALVGEVRHDDPHLHASAPPVRTST